VSVDWLKSGLNGKNTQKSLDFDLFDIQPKIISIFLAIIAKLRFLPTFYAERFWFEVYGFMNGSNSFFLAT